MSLATWSKLTTIFSKITMCCICRCFTYAYASLMSFPLVSFMQTAPSSCLIKSLHSFNQAFLRSIMTKVRPFFKIRSPFFLTSRSGLPSCWFVMWRLFSIPNVRSDKNVNENTIKNDEEEYYYYWWKNIHLLCGKKRLENGIYKIRPSFEQLRGGLSFKKGYKCIVQKEVGMVYKSWDKCTQ